MPIASLSSSFTSAVGSHGLYAVFGLMALDAVFPAFSELVMLYAGAVAAGVFAGAHHISLFGAAIGFGAAGFVIMALAGTLGYLAGSILGWAIGLYGGRPLLETRGRWLHVTSQRLERAERWFDRWGNAGVLLGRITPIVRSFVSIPAGVLEMPFAPYAVLTTIGSAIWAFSIAGIGYGLGSSYRSFDHGFKYAEYLVIAGVVLVAVYMLARVTRRRVSDPAR